MYIPPPLPPPSVGPSVRVATARSGFFSLVTYLRTCRRYSSGPPGRWWWSVDIFAAERHMYTKRKREIWVSLSRRAQIPHSTRTKVHGSAPLYPHHKPALHYCTTCYYYYGDKDPVCFKSRMFCFSCSAVLLPETYGIPYHHHAPLQGGRKDDAKLASSILHTLPY